MGSSAAAAAAPPQHAYEAHAYEEPAPVQAPRGPRLGWDPTALTNARRRDAEREAAAAWNDRDARSARRGAASGPSVQWQDQAQRRTWFRGRNREAEVEQRRRDGDGATGWTDTEEEQRGTYRLDWAGEGGEMEGGEVADLGASFRPVGGGDGWAASGTAARRNGTDGVDGVNGVNGMNGNGAG